MDREQADAPAGGAEDRRPDRERFIAGDPIRGLAALAVAFYHAAFFAMLGARQPSDLEIAYGEAGAHAIAILDVSIFAFLTLSGYLIAGPFIRAFIAGEPLPAARPYLRNRALRILPMYIVVVTIVLIRFGPRGDSFVDVLKTYAFFPSNTGEGLGLIVGQGWSLGVEALFYALVPLVAVIGWRALRERLGQRGRTLAVLVFAAGVSLASLGFRAAIPQTIGWQRTMPALAIGFMPGLVLAAIAADPRMRARVTGAGPWLTRAMVGVGVAALLVYQLALSGHDAFSPRPGWLPITLATLGLGLLVGACLFQQWAGRRVWRIVDNRPMHWLGRRSYSWYLVHQAIMVEMLTLTVSSLSSSVWARFAEIFAMTFPLSLLASALTWRLIEEPALSLRYPRPSGVARPAPAETAPGAQGARTPV